MITFIKFFLCGILTSLMFPPFFLISIGFVIFPLLFFFLTDKEFVLQSYKSHFFSGLIYGLGFFSIYLEWINEPFFVDEVTKKYALISYLLIIYCSLYFAIIFTILKYFKSTLSKLIVFPSLIICAEFICANSIYGFPWFSFSLVHSSNFFGTSTIFYVGTYGLSYITILIFLFPIIFFIKNKKLLKIFYTLIFVIIFTCTLFVSLRITEREQDNYKSMDISIIQLNLSINQFSDQGNIKEKYNEIIGIIKNNESDIIIFGENDYPFFMDINSINSIQNYIKKDQTIIIGSTRKDKKNYYNSLFLIKKNTYKIFDKKILVPFGEFIPLRSFFNFMEFIAGTIDFSKGNNSRNMQLNEDMNILPVICYEIIYFWKLINNDNDNTNVIINLTNDSWFGNFSGPYQHYYFAKLRSAEFNKKQIRVSNNGISGLINNYGKTIYATKLNTKEINNFKFSFNDQKNVFLKFHQLVFIFILIILLLGFYLNKKNDFK